MARETIDSFKGQVGFLSNFSPHSTRAFGRSWMTVEHGFQAAKFLPVAGWAGTPAYVEAIAQAPTPGQAKLLGQTREVACNPAWERWKRDVMFVLVLHKFELHSVLRELLLATGDATLVEGNTWGDDYWGAVWRDREPSSDFRVWQQTIDNSAEGREWRWLAGRNELGLILMTAREALR